ncbi:amino acid adenylation domain-containing protein [Paenibacillus algorifonticola]|uniref:Amino acid adenylation domain-containing protein n=1 Tax=Paenibacillus algorifonticola TaxID=684063 RepID=A0A1I2HG29_9BACL|nr:amino acid adenylation domain-containing protein [Paenibacillus algorifonticola]SFF28488.1 amino acid adenylation domain-containing protein [Paenibacillus algorifonticola]
MKSVFEREEAYWNEIFDAEDSMSFLPYSSPANKGTSVNAASNIGVICRTLPQELSAKILSLANGSDMAVYLIVMAGVNGLLYTYTHQEHTIVGMPAYSEPDDGNLPTQDVLLIKTRVNGESTIRTLLGQIKSSVSGAIEHQHIPFRKMVRPMNVEYNSLGEPVVPTVVSFANIHTDAGKNKTWTDTLFQFESMQGSMVLNLSFDSTRYDQDFMVKVTDHYIRLLSGILFQPDLAVDRADILSEAEVHEILTVFNDTDADYPREKTIHELFEEQAELHPDAVAVEYEDERLTYRELNERSNRLARTLRSQGVGADQLVGIMAERSPSMVIGILAILKAGGAYVPIDPEYPEERIRYMLDDSGASVLLLQAHLRDKATFAGVCLLLDDEQTYAADSASLVSVNQPNDLAYVIYTSGTTGKPKGTLIAHKNVVRLLFNSKNLFDFGSSDTWTLFHSFCFDFSVWEMYGALLYGGKLVIVPPMTAKQPAQFLQLLKERGVTILNQTPTYFYQLLREALAESGQTLSLRKVIFGGEALAPQQLKDWRKRYPATQLINMYGITETTVHVTYKEITEVEIAEGRSNIGRPIPTLKVYVLDGNRRCVPAGVAGEMYVAGEGLARGYLNRPELTAEKFVDDPFTPGERMYRSGDLARWLPDGNIEYMGRIDHQVKIRGYRIELGEVEAQLLKVESVQEAIVMAREDESGEKQLCAYVVADKPLTVSELRGRLSQEMPGYMIPSYFVQLEKMPLTSNGKTDRKALPAPEGSVNTGAEYTAPRTSLEEQLVRIWQEVLGTERIGVKDNFFDLGGHSLSLMQLIQKVYAAMGVEISLHNMFQNPSVEAMAYEIWQSGLEGHSGNRFMKLNENGPINVFCFPPGGGYGISYMELAKKLDDRCVLYAIDFIDDTDGFKDIPDRYVEEILRVQEGSPYVLLGYSLGGNLMYEVAQAIERRGGRVSDLIMLDSPYKKFETPMDEVESDIKEILEPAEGEEKELLDNPFIRERVERKVRAYLTYGAKLIHSGTVQANIHGLIAEGSRERGALEHRPSWQEATRQNYEEYQLAGVHEQVFAPEYVEENANVIGGIVQHIIERKMESHKVPF